MLDDCRSFLLTRVNSRSQHVRWTILLTISVLQLGFEQPFASCPMACPPEEGKSLIPHPEESLSCECQSVSEESCVVKQGIRAKEFRDSIRCVIHSLLRRRASDEASVLITKQNSAFICRHSFSEACSTTASSSSMSLLQRFGGWLKMQKPH